MGAFESGPPRGQSPVVAWQLALSGMALIGVCYGLARFAYGLFVPAFRAEFGLDASVTGAIGGASYLGYSILIVVSWRVTERLGARPVALAAGVIATTGMATVAAAPNATVLAGGVLLAGASTGIVSPPLAAAIARWSARPHRDRLQALVNGGTGLGVVLSGPVALTLAGQWRLAWALFALVAAVVTMWAARSIPPDDPAPRDPALGDAPCAQAAGGPKAQALAAAASAMGVVSASVWVFGRDVVETAGAMDPTLSGWLWVMLGAAGLLGASAGHLIDRIGLRLSWTATMLALAAAIAALGLVPHRWTLAFVAAAAFGAAYITLTGVLLVWGTRLEPARPAAGVGLAFLMLGVGQMIGAPIIGLLLAALPARSVFLTVALLAAATSALSPDRARNRSGSRRPSITFFPAMPPPPDAACTEGTDPTAIR